MDFSDFAYDPSQAALKSAEEYGNFVFSYATVTIWNAMTAIYMAVPVASYLGALDQTPEYLGENSWKWTYTVPAGQDSYSAKLITERISNEEFSVQMLITKDGFFADFKWFEGVVRYDHTRAKWTLYESPLNNEAWLMVEWNMDWEEEVSDLTYTIVKDGEEKDSFITMGITTDEDYDAYYTIRYSGADTYFKWNTETKAGNVMSETLFQDANWHCWDESLMNVDCN